MRANIFANLTIISYFSVAVNHQAVRCAKKLLKLLEMRWNFFLPNLSYLNIGNTAKTSLRNYAQ
jgi:hypothetical protein